MKNGEFTRRRHKTKQKEYIISGIDSINEEQDTQILYLFGQELSKLPLKTEEYKEKIKAVTKEQITEFAQKYTTKHNLLFKKAEEKMQIIENKLIKEKSIYRKIKFWIYDYVHSKSNTRKNMQYVEWVMVQNDNRFIKANERNETVIPDGVAHYLEHKMFEQESGVNSLDTLSSLGVEANAYTTNDHTAYLFECTNNFDKAIDELLNYAAKSIFYRSKM